MPWLTDTEGPVGILMARLDSSCVGRFLRKLLAIHVDLSLLSNDSSSQCEGAGSRRVGARICYPRGT